MPLYDPLEEDDLDEDEDEDEVYLEPDGDEDEDEGEDFCSLCGLEIGVDVPFGKDTKDGPICGECAYDE